MVCLDSKWYGLVWTLEGCSAESGENGGCFIVGTTASPGARPRFASRLVPTPPHGGAFFAGLQQVLWEQTLFIELQS